MEGPENSKVDNLSSSNSSTISSPSDQASPRSSGSHRGRKMTRDSANPLSAENLHKRGYHTLHSSFKPFHVENRWRLVRELGQGAYGMVISAEDKISGETVAIKMVTRVFDKVQLAKRALREIVLLRHFSTRGHENVTGLIDLDAIHPDFNDIYIFMEPMEADLHQIIRSGQQLTSEHIQYFLYQILRGMKYIHTASVLHRDLKPGNLLVNSDCELKICDFGLANTFEGANQLTEYVATRWYRAPEIMLSFRTYGTASKCSRSYNHSSGASSDASRCLVYWMYSSGTLTGETIVSGKRAIDQINRILDVLGTPGEDVFAKIASEKAKVYMRSLPVRNPQPFREIFFMADAQVIDLLSKMIVWDPDKRLTVVEALEHPWLTNYHDPADEPSCPAKFDKYNDYENLSTMEEFRTAIWKEIQDFRREVRSLHPPISTAPLIEQNVPEEEEPLEQPTDNPTGSNGTESAAAASVDVAKRVLSEPITEEPAVESGKQEESLDSFPPPLLRDQSSLVGSSDPIATYRRRSSVLQGSSSPNMQARNSLYSHQPFPSSGQPDGDASYIIPARSRAASILGGQSQLLRTLSTFSIHEKMDEAIKLLVATGADAPPSSIPQEFVSTGENIHAQEK